MEEILFGEGWLDRLMAESPAAPSLRDRVREEMAREKNRRGCARRWREVARLLEEGEAGRALEVALNSLGEAVDALRGSEGAEKDLDRPLSPFLVGGEEIRSVLPLCRDLKAYTRPLDDLELVRALELLNRVRRLLASWGASSWEGLPVDLLGRLDGDLEELREVRKELQGLGEEEDLESEAELADHYAEASTRFARDLFELHLSNARHPEMRMRFALLWRQVEQLVEDGSLEAAALEAFDLLEEAFAAAGLGGGDLLEMVDILYAYFSDPEGLRRAVDAVAALRRGAEDSALKGREEEVVGAVREALSDMGLLAS